MMHRVLIFAAFSSLILSCSKSEKGPAKYRLSSYRQVYESAKEILTYTGKYEYSKSGLLVSETQRDTTFYKALDQYVPVRTDITYVYDEQGFLKQKIRAAISIQVTNTLITDYEYDNGLLSLERTGNRIIEYRYEANGRLKTTISNLLSNGSKTVTEYDDDIPKSLVKTTDGFVIQNSNETTYLDQQLLVKRYERTSGGSLVFEQDYQQDKNGLPEGFLPTFKGFPKIKSFAYRKGVERQIITYQTISGKRVLSDEKNLNPEFDQYGKLVKNKGIEQTNLETTNPIRKELTFTWTYEPYR